jgi:hypothetical protein
MADPQDFTDDELLQVYRNPKADLAQLTPDEMQRLDRLTTPSYKGSPADVQAAQAQAQAQAEAGASTLAQLTPTNVLHDLGTAAQSIYGTAKAVAAEALKNPLGINQPQIDPNNLNREGLGADLGRLRTLPQRIRDAWNTMTPDQAAALGGSVAGAALIPVVAHGATKISPSGISAFGKTLAGDIPVVRKFGPAVTAYQEAAMSPAAREEAQIADAIAAKQKSNRIKTAVDAAVPPTPRAGTLKTAKVPPTPAEQMGLSPTATGNVMESLPDTPAPERGRAPVPPELQIRDIQDTKNAEAAAARAAQSAELGVSPTATGATMESLPATPAPEPARTPIPISPETRAAGAAADASEQLRTAASEMGISPTATGNVLESLPETPVPEGGREAMESPSPEVMQSSAEADARRQALEAELGAPKRKPVPLPPLRGANSILGQQPPPRAPVPPPPLRGANSILGGETPAGEAPAPPQPPQEPPKTPPPPPEPPPAGEPDTVVPREEKTEDELARDRMGARDYAAQLRREGQTDATTESVRETTRNRFTGQKVQTSNLPKEATERIIARTTEMLDKNASDADLMHYLMKGRAEDRPAIQLLMEGLMRARRRETPWVGLGAAAGGAALRQALLNQLSGKDEQQ